MCNGYSEMDLNARVERNIDQWTNRRKARRLYHRMFFNVKCYCFVFMLTHVCPFRRITNLDRSLSLSYRWMSFQTVLSVQSDSYNTIRYVLYWCVFVHVISCWHLEFPSQRKILTFPNCTGFLNFTRIRTSRDILRVQLSAQKSLSLRF